MAMTVRLGDICSGHGCFPPRPNAQGSPNVYCNGRPVHRVTDAWAVHCCVTCHPSVLAAGSPTVFANGLSVGRVGDPVACGSTCATGSSDTFTGG